MRAFFIGLVFLLAVALLAGLGVLLTPLLLALAVALRLVLMVALVLLGVWLLGKLIVFVWENLKTGG